MQKWRGTILGQRNAERMRKKLMPTEISRMVIYFKKIVEKKI